MTKTNRKVWIWNVAGNSCTAISPDRPAEVPLEYEGGFMQPAMSYDSQGRYVVFSGHVSEYLVPRVWLYDRIDDTLTCITPPSKPCFHAKFNHATTKITFVSPYNITDADWGDGGVASDSPLTIPSISDNFLDNIAAHQDFAGYGNRLFSNARMILRAATMKMSDIYVMNLDGTGIKRITNYKAEVGRPQFNDDDTELYMCSFDLKIRNNENPLACTLYKCDADFEGKAAPVCPPLTNYRLFEGDAESYYLNYKPVPVTLNNGLKVVYFFTTANPFDAENDKSHKLAYIIDNPNVAQPIVYLNSTYDFYTSHGQYWEEETNKILFHAKELSTDEWQAYEVAINPNTGQTAGDPVKLIPPISNAANLTIGHITRKNGYAAFDEETPNDENDQ
jgi:hypothetical protein